MRTTIFLMLKAILTFLTWPPNPQNDKRWSNKFFRI